MTLKTETKNVKLEFLLDHCEILLKLQNRTRAKAEIVRDYEMFGLIILVAVPLPGTGAWTGALVAALMKLDLKYALISIGTGVVIAGCIVMGITYGFISI